MYLLISKDTAAFLTADTLTSFADSENYQGPHDLTAGFVFI